MKNLTTRAVFAVAIALTMSFVTWAAETKKNVTFNNDVTVNGTVVKKGTYKVVYDEKTGEMTILKGKTEIVKTTAQAKDRPNKATRTELIYTQSGDARNLQGIAFDGSSQTLVLGNGGAAATPQQ